MTKAFLEWLKKLIAENKVEEFYHSWEWRSLSADILKEQKECQVCKSKHRYGPADVAHHINHVKKHPELALSRYDHKGNVNIIAVCKKCHKEIHHPSRFFNEERW